MVILASGSGALMEMMQVSMMSCENEARRRAEEENLRREDRERQEQERIRREEARDAARDSQQNMMNMFMMNMMMQMSSNTQAGTQPFVPFNINPSANLTSASTPTRVSSPIDLADSSDSSQFVLGKRKRDDNYDI